MRLSSNSYYLRYFHVFCDHFPYSLEFNHLLYNHEQQNYTIRYFILPLSYVSLSFGLDESYSFIQCFRIDCEMSLNPKICSLMVQSSNSFRYSRLKCAIWISFDAELISGRFQLHFKIIELTTVLLIPLGAIHHNH